MFAFCATSRGDITLPELESMAAALRGAAGKPATWCDERGRAGFAAATPGNQWTADAAAQWGMEDRDPTGDRRMIDLLLSFPLEAFSIAGWPRGLARALGIGRVPDGVRFRGTRGAQVPEIARITAVHSAKYRDALEGARRSPHFRSIFEPDRVRALLKRACGGSAGTVGAVTLDRVADVSLFLAGGCS